eukprot:scaffold286178_cov57-Attheya_sp.AAC.2
MTMIRQPPRRAPNHHFLPATSSLLIGVVLVTLWLSVGHVVPADAAQYYSDRGTAAVVAVDEEEEELIHPWVDTVPLVIPPSIALISTKIIMKSRRTFIFGTRAKPTNQNFTT